MVHDLSVSHVFLFYNDRCYLTSLVKIFMGLYEIRTSNEYAKSNILHDFFGREVSH